MGTTSHSFTSQKFVSVLAAVQIRIIDANSCILQNMRSWLALDCMAPPYAQDFSILGVQLSHPKVGQT